jgi:hypothetical protein
MQPQGGVGAALAPQHRHAQLQHCQQSSAHGRSPERASVEPRTLHQQKGRFTARPQVTELPEQSTIDEGLVEIEHGLALDKRPATYTVVACGKTCDEDVGTQSPQRLRYATRHLCGIDHDRDPSICHRDNVPSGQRPMCAYSSHEVRRK